MVFGYLIPFTFLALTLQAGMGLGVAYGIWAALGVALTAVASRLLFKEPLNWSMAIEIVVIRGGMVLIESGGVHWRKRTPHDNGISPGRSVPACSLGFARFPHMDSDAFPDGH